MYKREREREGGREGGREGEREGDRGIGKEGSIICVFHMSTLHIFIYNTCMQYSHTIKQTPM